MMRLCFLVLWVSAVGFSGVAADEKDNLDVVQVALDDAMRPASQYYYYDYQMWMTNLSFSITNLDYHKVMKDGALHFGVLWKIKNSIAENLGVAFENVSVFLYPGNVAINVLAVVEAPESQKLKVKATPNDLGTKITTAIQGIANIAAATADHNANDVGIGLYASRHDDPQPIVTPAPTNTLTATSDAAVTAVFWTTALQFDAVPVATSGGPASFGFTPAGLNPGALAKFVACPGNVCASATCPTLLTAENALNVVVAPGSTVACGGGGSGAAGLNCGGNIYPSAGVKLQGFTSADLGGVTLGTATTDGAENALALCIQDAGKSPTKQTVTIPKCDSLTGGSADQKKNLVITCR